MLDLARLKAQLKIDDDFTAEDSLLSSYLLAGQKAASNYLARVLIWNESIELADAADDAINAEDDIELAVLMMAGHWYANREAVVIGTIVATVPFAFTFLLDPYRLIEF